MAFALEGCTGWRYVVEELHRAGITAHVAEPAETAARRGPKRRAKTDRSDAQLLRDLLLEGRIPESWIPPQPVLEARALVRLYKDLLDERTGWLQRVHASMFQMGVPDLDVSTMSAAGRDRITAAELSAATRTAVDVAMRQVDRLTAEMTMVREQIHAIGRRQPACRALQAAHYGIGPLTSRRDLGRRSATAAVSPAPTTRSATPGWTSRCSRRRTPHAEAPRRARTADAALGAV